MCSGENGALLGFFFSLFVGGGGGCLRGGYGGGDSERVWGFFWKPSKQCLFAFKEGSTCVNVLFVLWSIV